MRAMRDSLGVCLQAGGRNKFKTSSSKGSDDDYQPGRLERVAAAATKQSLRVHALQLAPPTPLTALLPVVREAAVSLVAVGGAQPVLEVLQQARAEPGYSRWAAAWCAPSAWQHSAGANCIMALVGAGSMCGFCLPCASSASGAAHLQEPGGQL